MNYENLEQTALAAGTGYATYTGGKILLNKAKKPYVSKVVLKSMQNYSAEDNKLLSEAASKALERSPLKDKVIINNINTDNYEKFAEEVHQKISDKTAKWIKKIRPKYKLNSKDEEESLKKLKNKFKLMGKGKNACFVGLTNQVYVNNEKMSAATFHELGHAKNANTKGFGKLMHNIRRPFALAVPLILSVGLLKQKKEDGEKPVGAIDKTTTFIKDNAGKLTFFAMLPTLVEEGLASIKGAKLAKDGGLSANLLKRVNTGNFKAWTTYLLGTLITVGAVKLGIEVSDKMKK